MARIQIGCPSCAQNGMIEVSEEAVKNVSRGLLAVNIAAHTICDHSFIVYVDKNLHVRDYFVADFQIEIPDLPVLPAQKIKETKLPSKEIVDIDLIKLNMPAMLLTYVLKSIFSKQKIVLISDQEFLKNHINNFFNYITKDTFDIDVAILTPNNYNQNKKQYKDCMIFEGNKIVKNMKKLINPKKLWVEKHIVHRFLTEPELGYSYIILKNEVQKAFELSKAIVEAVKESRKDGEKENVLKITGEVEDYYKIKIGSLYLNFLIEIVQTYFDVAVPTVVESFFNSL
jgi:hypothetical protein